MVEIVLLVDYFGGDVVIIVDCVILFYVDIYQCRCVWIGQCVQDGIGQIGCIYEFVLGFVIVLDLDLCGVGLFGMMQFVDDSGQQM